MKNLLLVIVSVLFSADLILAQPEEFAKIPNDVYYVKSIKGVADAYGNVLINLRTAPMDSEKSVTYFLNDEGEIKNKVSLNVTPPNKILGLTYSDRFFNQYSNIEKYQLKEIDHLQIDKVTLAASHKKIDLKIGNKEILLGCSENGQYLYTFSTRKKSKELVIRKLNGDQLEEFAFGDIQMPDFWKHFKKKAEVGIIKADSRSSVKTGKYDKKFYISDSTKIYCTLDRKDTTHLLTLDLAKNTNSYQAISPNTEGFDFNKLRSFIHGERIFLMAANSENLSLSMYELDSLREIQKHLFNEEEILDLANSNFYESYSINTDFFGGDELEKEKQKKRFLTRLNYSATIPVFYVKSHSNVLQMLLGFVASGGNLPIAGMETTASYSHPGFAVMFKTAFNAQDFGRLNISMDKDNLDRMYDRLEPLLKERQVGEITFYPYSGGYHVAYQYIIDNTIRIDFVKNL